MARLGRTQLPTFRLVRTPAFTSTATSEGGSSAGGGAPTGTAVKVAVLGGSCSGGGAGTGLETATTPPVPPPMVLVPPPRRRPPQFDRIPNGFMSAGAPTDLSANPEGGTTAGGGAPTGIARKIAIVSRVCSAGGTGSAVATKRAPQKGPVAGGGAPTGRAAKRT